MSIGGFWRRYLETGEYLATCEPELFPSVVVLLEALAHPDETGESELRGFLQAALGCVLPGPDAPANPVLTAALISDALILADPSLVDVPELVHEVEAFSDDERAAAMNWARDKVAMMLDQVEHEPMVPHCVDQLYACAVSNEEQGEAL